MTNYKVLPFTEENLKLESAEVWSEKYGKAQYCARNATKWLVHFGQEEGYGIYDDKGISAFSEAMIEIRIPVKQYTVAEVWDEAAIDNDCINWEETNAQHRNAYIQFACRIAELAKANQLKLD